MRRCLDLMTGVFMLRQLPPWFENLGKRQVKAPKVHVRDSGVLHALLGLGNRRDLEHHPSRGRAAGGAGEREMIFGPNEDKCSSLRMHRGIAWHAAGVSACASSAQSRSAAD